MFRHSNFAGPSHMLSRLLSVPPLLTVAERPAAVLFLPDVMHRAGAGASDVMESSGLGQRLRSKGFTTWYAAALRPCRHAVDAR
jgi:hypothetical protein